MDDFKVSLPQPCDESWEAMAPRGCNRHCAQCDTLIHDLAAMTLDEAEALIGTGEKVCVRAQVAPDGVVRLADAAQRQTRRMVAVVGASLAVAACQTPIIGQVTPRYEISGQLGKDFWQTSAVLEASDGRKYKANFDRERRFSFTNLRAGSYSLTIADNCGKVRRVDTIEVGDKDVDLGRFTADPGDDCIIVGVMTRQDGNRRAW